MTLIFFAMFGTFFLVSQYFQLVLGYSALESGLFQLPMAVVMMMLSPQVPRLVDRFGVARVVPVGLELGRHRPACCSRCSASTPSIWCDVRPDPAASAAGMALTMTPLTTLIMSSVPLGKAGVGSAMNDTTRELGGALGVAVLGSLVTSTYTSSIGDAVGGLVRRGPGGGRVRARRCLRRRPAPRRRRAPSSCDAAKQAFVDGMGVAALTGAAVVAVAAVISYRLLPHGTPAPVAQVDDRDLSVIEAELAIAD